MSAVRLNPEWPVLKSYRRDFLRRIALPLGGIGTGTVSLGGRGDLRDWEIVNRPAKGFTPERAFFALYAKTAGAAAITKAIEGSIDPADYEGYSGSPIANHGLPRFRECAFHTAYPFAQITFSDPDMPVDVRLEALNPFIPADADSSGIPIAMLRYVLINKTNKTVKAAIAGTVPNFIGQDGSCGAPCHNVNQFKRSSACSGLFMRSDGVDVKAEQYGTMALATTARRGVSYCRDWGTCESTLGLQHFWDDFTADGTLSNRGLDAADYNPAKSLETRTVKGSVAVSITLGPKRQKAVTFVLAWHFPNRQTWTAIRRNKKRIQSPDDCIGNYYTTQYRHAWDVVQKTVLRLRQLEKDTVAFVDTFCQSDLPECVKEAALFNLSTLRTQTCFRTPDGYFYGFEGSCDCAGCCFGNCTHVWNYEPATAFLFGGLAQTMRRIEFVYGLDSRGMMRFRTPLPLYRKSERWNVAAADGQMGTLVKLYREWQLSGDMVMLAELWPKAKKVLAFCWIKGGWDADGDGVMEGCQHNTMDVEYFGPNPQMQLWYLAALKACEKMARHLQDDAFADKCCGLYESGSAWTDEHLFNGEYYEHHSKRIAPENIAEGLIVNPQAKDLTAPPQFQLGKGCLVDQLVGQVLAHMSGLGHLAAPVNIKKTLRSIMKYNFRKSMHDHFNHMRTYALNDESALLMCTYPKDERPKIPFPYHTEVMTGFEYTAAVGMIYEGQIDNALKCIRAIRDRYDGRSRSPFNEAECGHHYARAMMAWGAVNALTGFAYSAVDGIMTFAAKEGTHFWSNGYAWGQCRIKKSARASRLNLP